MTTTQTIDALEIRFAERDSHGTDTFEQDPYWADTLRSDLNLMTDEEVAGYLADLDAFARNELAQANVYRRENESPEFSGCIIEVTAAGETLIGMWTI